VNLYKAVGFTVPLPVTGTQSFLLRFRHRNAASPGGALRAGLRFFDATTSVTKQASVSLGQAHPDWSTRELVFEIQPAELPQITQINVEFTAGLADGLTCCLDLDAIELVDLGSGAPLLDDPAWSFAAPLHDATRPGDYAANAIDRLGAIAWWGSSSHHLSGGWAFSKNERFYGAFFMGRSLGESLLLTTGGESGIVYGDPLYRPVAVRIHRPGLAGYGEAPGLAVSPGNLAVANPLFLNVLRGTANLELTRWSLASCPVHDPAQCADDALWIERASGTGAVVDLPVDWTGFLDPGSAQDLLLRLRVWNPGEEADELFNYAYLSWTP
jgi:hypothetical protein